MLKQRDPVTATSSACVDDRPRKKLSFREPEVEGRTINGGPLSVPTENSLSKGRHPLNRPHSIAGVLGLTGFSNSSGPDVKRPLSSSVPPNSFVPSSPIPHIKKFITTRIEKGRKFEKEDVIEEWRGIQCESIENNDLHTKQKKTGSIQEHRSQTVSKSSRANSGSPKRPSRSSPLSNDDGRLTHDPKVLIQTSPLSQRLKLPHADPLRSQRLENLRRLRDDVTERRPVLQETAILKSDDESSAAPTNRSPSPEVLPKKRSSSAVPVDRTKSAELTTGEDKEATSLSLENLSLDSQAMRIVRTIGQAFEVCHKYSAVKNPCPPSPSSSHSNDDSDDSAHKRKHDIQDQESGQIILSPDDPCDSSIASTARAGDADLLTSSPSRAKRQPNTSKVSPGSGDSGRPDAPLALQHELQLVREQLEQQQQQTQAAVAQVHLLRDQLAAETAARLEAQARTHQLLVHNKELLEHIQALVLQIRELEITSAPAASAPPPTLPPPPDTTTPPTPSLQNSPRLHHQLQQQLHHYQLQQQLQHHQLQQQQIEQQLQQSQQQQFELLQRSSNSSSEQSSRESVTACVANLFPQDTHSPSHLSKQHSSSSTVFFPGDPQPYPRLPLVPENAALPSLIPPSCFNFSPAGMSGLGCSAPPLGLSSINPGPITRAASERMPRQNTLAQLQRMSWGRHTTK